MGPASKHPYPAVAQPEQVFDRTAGALPIGHANAGDLDDGLAERIDQHHRNVLIHDAPLVGLGQHADHENHPGRAQRSHMPSARPSLQRIGALQPCRHHNTALYRRRASLASPGRTPRLENFS